MKKKTLSYQHFRNLSDDAINRMKRSQLVSEVNRARKLSEKRISQFQTAGKNVYSPAVHQYVKKLVEKGLYESVSKMRREDLIKEMYIFRNFLNAKTATVKGARAWGMEQDRRIFGVTDKGKPLQRMDQDSRKRYWDIYNEFMNIHHNANEVFGSTWIQQMLAEIVRTSEPADYRQFDYGAFYEKISKLKKKDEEERNQWMNEYQEMGNVFIGRGNAVIKRFRGKNKRK